MADRYLRTGTEVPKIYSGDLNGLTVAMAETEAWSRVQPGQHFLEDVYGGVRDVLQVYEDGACTYYRAREGDDVSIS